MAVSGSQSPAAPQHPLQPSSVYLWAWIPPSSPHDSFSKHFPGAPLWEPRARGARGWNESIPLPPERGSPAASLAPSPSGSQSLDPQGRKVWAASCPGSGDGRGRSSWAIRARRHLCTVHGWRGPRDRREETRKHQPPGKQREPRGGGGGGTGVGGRLVTLPLAVSLSHDTIRSLPPSPFLRVQCSGIKCTHAVVRSSPPSTSGTLHLAQQALSPLNTSSLCPPPLAPGTHLSTLSLSRGLP